MRLAVFALGLPDPRLGFRLRVVGIWVRHTITPIVEAPPILNSMPRCPEASAFLRSPSYDFPTLSKIL